MGLSHYRFDYTWGSVNEHLPALSRLCHIGYDVLGHLLSCEFSGTTKFSALYLCTRHFHNGLCGHREFSSVFSVPRLGILLPGGLENLFQAPKANILAMR
jgi:hypothetical protein